MYTTDTIVYNIGILLIDVGLNLELELDVALDITPCLLYAFRIISTLICVLEINYDQRQGFRLITIHNGRVYRHSRQVCLATESYNHRTITTIRRCGIPQDFYWGGGGGGGGEKDICARTHITSDDTADVLKSLTAGVQSLLKGPGSSSRLTFFLCSIVLSEPYV